MCDKCQILRDSDMMQLTLENPKCIRKVIIRCGSEEKHLYVNTKQMSNNCIMTLTLNSCDEPTLKCTYNGHDVSIGIWVKVLNWIVTDPDGVEITGEAVWGDIIDTLELCDYLQYPVKYTCNPFGFMLQNVSSCESKDQLYAAGIRTYAIINPKDGKAYNAIIPTDGKYVPRVYCNNYNDFNVPFGPTKMIDVQIFGKHIFYACMPNDCIDLLRINIDYKDVLDNCKVREVELIKKYFKLVK